MSRFRSLFLFSILWLSALASRAQSLFVGAFCGNGGPVAVTGVETFIQLSYAAGQDGSVNVAEFRWSQAPCPGAVKIKFFRPANALFSQFTYVDQRGPFDATSTYQRVRLDPPVSLHRGDLVAITNVTSCGGPVIAAQETPLPGPLPPPGPYYAVPGDVTSSFVPTTLVPISGPAVAVDAEDQRLLLLNGRFRITMAATNPRTGATTPGYPISDSQGTGTWGFFSLPDFTFDAGIPEVVVKMVDATGSPALGDDFWFFHAPLTDVSYVLTVEDQITGAVRTYSNTPGDPGQLCGAVDTSAFP